jgi:hypothetical protein
MNGRKAKNIRRDIQTALGPALALTLEKHAQLLEQLVTANNSLAQRVEALEIKARVN